MASDRALIYLPVDQGIKDEIGKIASVSGKSEADVFLECAGIVIDKDKLTANLKEMKIRVLAQYLDIDAGTLQGLLKGKNQPTPSKTH